MNRFGLVLLGFAVLALSSGQAGSAREAQQDSGGRGSQPAATFRSEVGIVEIDAVVTDAAGNFVRDLTRDDFQIFEDGRPRPFSLFSLVEVPLLPSAPLTAPEPDVQTLGERQNGRIYVVVLDDLHTAALRTTLLKAAARRFIEQYFHSGDRAAIVYTGAGQGSGQALTGSRRLLLSAIDRFRGQQMESAAEGRLDSYRRQQASDPADQSNRLTDPNDAERSFNARRALSTLRDAASWMADIQGRRKSLIFFSEGLDYNITDVFNAPGATGVLMDARDSIGAAARANVSIYSIDPRGLSGLSSDFIDLIEPQATTQIGRDQLGTRGIERDLRTAQDNLRMLAEQTGGLSLVNSNDFAGGFERIVRDNSTYYVLGYETRPDARGGKFHTIDVRVRRAGLNVRARRGYVDPDSKAKVSKDSIRSGRPSVLLDALSSPVPAGNLPMSVFAAAFKGDGKGASVLIAAEISGASLKFREQDGTFFDDVEFSLLAAGPDGRVEETDSGKAALAVKPEIRQRITRHGVRFLSRIALPPARYQLRVAVRETGGGAAGVVHYDLDVPDFSKEQVSMSGVVLTAPSANATATSRGDAVLQGILPAPPTAVRTFLPEDVVTAYLEVYDNTMSSMAHGFDIVTNVRGANGTVVFSSHREETRQASKSGQTFPHAVTIPLKELPHGAYVLRVEVRSRLANGAVVYREIPFSIG
jgi:VWFA-related protein